MIMRMGTLPKYSFGKHGFKQHSVLFCRVNQPLEKSEFVIIATYLVYEACVLIYVLYVIDCRPLPPEELNSRIYGAYGEDVSTAVLTQVIMHRTITVMEFSDTILRLTICLLKQPPFFKDVIPAQGAYNRTSCQ
jgi:hypothetical protein